MKDIIKFYILVGYFFSEKINNYIDSWHFMFSRYKGQILSAWLCHLVQSTVYVSNHSNLYMLVRCVNDVDGLVLIRVVSGLE